MYKYYYYWARVFMGACDRLVDDPTTETADPRTPPRIAAETLTRELPGFPPDRK